MNLFLTTAEKGKTGRDAFPAAYQLATTEFTVNPTSETPHA